MKFQVCKLIYLYKSINMSASCLRSSNVKPFLSERVVFYIPCSVKKLSWHGSKKKIIFSDTATKCWFACNICKCQHLMHTGDGQRPKDHFGRVIFRPEHPHAGRSDLKPSTGVGPCAMHWAPFRSEPACKCFDLKITFFGMFFFVCSMISTSKLSSQMEYEKAHQNWSD